MTIMDLNEQPRVSKRDFISRVAARTELPIRLVSTVYEGLLDELRDLVRARSTVVLTGFGRFYLQEHKGHKVRFGKSAVNDYSVLKFSASRSMNRELDQELDSPDEAADQDDNAEETDLAEEDSQLLPTG
ncbi:HU family DNA-binding protein [Kocuria palustris]|uniref:HU family DNA-binding protein n=1 Tax=Kocuria palustris TaxID=71999 RepID=UPI003CF580B9